jgi:hypothetical protein
LNILKLKKFQIEKTGRKKKTKPGTQKRKRKKNRLKNRTGKGKTEKWAWFKPYQTVPSRYIGITHIAEHAFRMHTNWATKSGKGKVHDGLVHVRSHSKELWKLDYRWQLFQNYLRTKLKDCNRELAKDRGIVKIHKGRRPCAYACNSLSAT